MSYRIHFGIVKKKDLENHLSKHFGNGDDDYDKKWDFFNDSWAVELFDETPIEQFHIVKGFEDEEYPPYVLSKKDFKKILDFYKHFLKESFEKKEHQLDKIKSKDDIELREISNINCHYYYLKCYFSTLIEQKKNISESGLFLLDYFYLVKLYENWKNGQRGLITHG